MSDLRYCSCLPQVRFLDTRDHAPGCAYTRIAELEKLNTELVDKGNHYIVDNSRLAKENQRLRDAARDAILEWREVIRGDFDGVTGGNTDDVTERLGTLLGVGDE